ncbi:MAG: DUF1631 domain-containing protein, partial [Gammaproteobacteria bacterium]|nr:DUF1631 domain-containing protein [Gammaproteobacteria bacterium]
MNPAIKRLEKQSSTTLLSLLDDMFASCDDLFFDLASRAQSNLEQNLYFESMREVRVRTEECRQRYKDGLAKSFNELGQTEHLQASGDALMEDMSLVGDEDVELEVAVKSMTTRARVAAKQPLYEFHSRIETLFPGHIDEEKNPLDAGALITLFVTAANNIALDIKAKIILLKQYERFVINRLSEIYVSANKLLEELGVKFIDERKRSGSGGARASAGGAGQAIDQGLLDEATQQHYLYSSPALNELSALLGRLRGSPQATQSYNFARAPLFSAGEGAPLSSDDLLKALQAAPGATTSDASAFDLRNFMRQLLRREQKDNQKLGVEQVDEDIINLVAMFFDFVLDDHNIPDNVKALIGRLQMPVLKVALKDKTIFTNTEHPCRHFINELSRVSIGLSQSDDDASELLEKMEQWVHDIQNEAENHEQAFDDARKELQNYSASIEKRAELVEKRTSEGAQGQARKQVAKMKAQKAIQEAMDGKVVAKPVADFIVNLWQQVLYRAHIKEGDESAMWLANLQTMQDLIWCSQPHDDEKSRKRLERIRANLIVKLRDGLKETTLNQTQIDALAADIEQTIDKVAGASDEPGTVVDLEPFQADKEQALETLAEQKSWKEMTALERQQQQHKALTYEFIERADSVAIGSWLEFKVPASGTVI